MQIHNFTDLELTCNSNGDDTPIRPYTKATIINKGSKNPIMAHFQYKVCILKMNPLIQICHSFVIIVKNHNYKIYLPHGSAASQPAGRMVVHHELIPEKIRIHNNTSKSLCVIPYYREQMVLPAGDSMFIESSKCVRVCSNTSLLTVSGGHVARTVNVRRMGQNLYMLPM